ncbi:MAG: archaeal proteasome endopeptidase complex subunit alpha [Candidatus Hodarchaeales archaeon]|jgi:proteasome alpha subunit
MYDSRVPYDKSAAIWSPDGELVQLSYARKASERGAAAVGMIINKKTILLAGETLYDSLVVRPDKIQKIDNNLFIVASGLSTDSNLLIGQARLVAQQHRLVYGEKISIRALASRLGDLMARHTITGGLRPFGTALILAGFSPVDKESQLFFVDNGGSFFAVKAYAAGSGNERVIDALRKQYKVDLEVEAASALVLEILTSALGKKEPMTEKDVDVHILTPE